MNVTNTFQTNAVNAYTVIENENIGELPDLDSTMWFMQNHRTVPDEWQDEYEILTSLDLIYRPLFASSTSTRHGFSFTYEDSGLTYQYPLDRLDYLTDSKYIDDDCTLGQGYFDMRCTKLNKDL